MIEQQKCNNDNYIKYENCDLYINVLFYVLSYIDFESIDDSFNEILKLIENCFQLTPAQAKELKETYYCNPDLLPNDNNNKIFALRKNKSIIHFYNSEIGNSFNFLNKIPSLLNTLFNCLLCSDTEPILLIGPTGYKTYLIKELLKKDVKIVTLNEESNIDTLLGSTGFFTKEELKFFYLSLICDICFENRKVLLLQDLKDGKLNLKNIEIEIHQFFSPNICEKREVFKYLVNRTFKKLKDLLDNQNDDDDPNILNNIKLEFKPGLFTSAILSGKSLDLRNFDKIPTTTLERFNELFTGMKTLTLNEDKFNTITTARNKTICKTVDFIRFFATSLSKNYSESVLSRWTVINTKEYEFEELKEVLRICANQNKLDISQNDIEYLIELAKYFKITNRKTVSIKLLINAIELYHDMNKNLGDLKEEEKKTLYYINRQFIYYITLKSIIEQSKDDPNLSEKELNNNLYKYLFQNNEGRQIKIQIKYGESPFIFVNKNNLDGIKSLITNAFIPCIKHQFPKIKPAFTNIFVEMVNLIHLGISLNETIILEGQIGQGKQTAIKYISELLGLKLLNIQLASSNKEEDLLGKVIVDKDKKTNATIIKVNETDLMKILKNKNVDKYLIVFNDIQNASDAVKEKIANICDRHQDYILLPDGETINKPKINVICVINTDYNSDIRNKLPSPLLYSTIYHKIGEISDEDIINTTISIFKKYFEKEKINDEKEWIKEAKDFLEKYNKVNRILIENKSKQLLTFNDINNYAKLRAATKKTFDNKLMVDNIIFYYRTQEEEYLEKIKKELNLNGFGFIPIFEYNPCHTELFIRIDKNDSKGLIIGVINKDKIDVNEIKKKINTLTNYQKQCIFFLACAWVTKIKVIIKGNTASGKTHCASIFAQMLGADLLTYQINQDLTPSIFNGQTILEENLNEKEIENIKSYLSDINKINLKLTQAIPSDSNLWFPSKFNIFFKKLDEIIKRDKLSEENKKLLFKAKYKISCIISPQGRFKEAESQTSLGLINGSWFLYDDIQFATSDLLSIMTPLCSEKPSINLFNAKDSPKYTSEIEDNSMKNVKLINPNFNLIMTFNPKYCKNSNGLDPILENKCLSFNLPSNDINYESTAQIFYGGLLNSNNDYEISYQLGGKLASVHMLSKKKSLENKEFFEGDSIFTSRTINRAIKYIEKKIFENISKGKDINLSNIIKVIIDKLYARPFIHQGFINNGEKSYQLLFREEIVKNFSKEIDKYSRTYSGNDFDDNKKLLEQLRDIQIGITESKAKEFKFLEFVTNSLNIKLESIYFILNHIDSTLTLINNSAINLSSQHVNNYYQISIIYKILNNIMKYGIKVSGKYNRCSLNDPQLLEFEQLKWPILRLKLLEKLLRDKNNKLFPQILKREYINKSTEEDEEDIFENKISMDILILISEMVKNPEIISFINLIKYINENLKSFEEIKTYINNYIPYYKFRSTHLDEISEWLPLILKCIDKNQKFKINFGNEIEYIFENNQRKEKGKFDKLNFYFTSNELKLSHHSEYKIQGEKLSINKEKKDKDTVFRFYYFVNKILEVTNLNDYIFKKIKDESKKKNSFKKEKRYLYFKISNLFENNSVKNSVGKFWMVIYNMNVKSVEAFKSILTTNEQNIFNLFLRFYNNDKIEELDKFIKFTESLEFYNENLIVLKLEADQYYVSQKIKKFQSSQKTERDKNDLEILQNVSLKMEKQKFESINYYTSEIGQDKIVNLYNELIQKVEDVFIADKETKEKKELKNKYDELKKKISKLDTKKLKNISCFKDSLLTQIELISKNNEIDKDNYRLYENKYEQLERSIKNNSKYIEQSKNNIKWPILFLEINLNKSKICKFIENLIWYSEIKNIIDNIKINNNKEDKFKYQLKLQDYEEMKYASNLIMSTDELIDNEFNMIYATLNSHFIIKMVHDNLENYLFNSAVEINEILKNNLLLINQSDINNKNDYYYIQEKVKELGNDFILQIPKFTSKDIVFLYIQFGSKNKKGDYEPFQGPILKQIQYNRILDVLLVNKINLLNDERGKKLAETSAKEIIYDLSKNTFKIEESFDNFSENIDTKILELKDPTIKRDTQKEKDFSNIFKITLDIARKIDKMNEKNNIELSYEDTDFLDDEKLEKIYKNIENTTKYPHLIYILNKYEIMYDDLIEIYKIHKKEKKLEINKIPIWLILLRLLCNINNIEVDYIQENSYLSKRISENQSIYIRNLINEFSNSYYNNYNVKFDYKWLNISIKQLNSIYVYSRKSRNLFDYVYSQIQSLPELKKEISDIIENNLIELNKEIINEQLKDNIEKFYNLLLTDNNKLTQIINNPKKFYLNEIRKNYDEIMNKFLNSDEFKEMREYYNGETQNSVENEKDKKSFISIYNSLKNEINNTLKNIDNDYKKVMDEKIKNKYEKKIDELTSLINYYNKDIKNLKKFYINDLIKENEKMKEFPKCQRTKSLVYKNNNSQNWKDNSENKMKNHNFYNSKLTYNEFNESMLQLHNHYVRIKEEKININKTKLTPIFIYAKIDLEFKKKIIDKNDINIKFLSSDIKMKINIIEEFEINDKIYNFKNINEGTKESIFIPLNKEKSQSYDKLFEFKQDNNKLPIYYKDNNIKVIFYFKDEENKKKGIEINIKIAKYEIENYDINNINKEKIRAQITQDISKHYNKKIILFGNTKNIEYKELYDKLDDFNLKNKNFGTDINEIFLNNKINCEDILKQMNNLSKKTEEISDLLQCKCSDDTQFPNIANELDKIKAYFTQLNLSFKKFDKYIKDNVNKFMTSFFSDQSILNKMLNNTEIKIPTSNFDQKFSLNTIDPDSNELCTLVINENEGIISCSRTEIFANFGSYITSLIKGEFSINILSISNQKLYASIDENGLPDKKYEKNILISKIIEPNELFSINIKTPRKNEEKDEKIDIKFNLKLMNDNSSKLLLPCSFSFVLCALKIKIECLEYKLIIKNDELILGTKFLEENERITFILECLNKNTEIGFKVAYKSNKENEAKEPALIQEKNNFILELQNEYNNVNINEKKFKLKLFNAILFIYITNDIFIPITINSKITPFKFKLSAYDFCRPEIPAENKLVVYYGNEQIKKEHKLFFKITMPEKKRKYLGKINLKYEKSQLIINSKLKDEFEISETMNFNIEYKIENKFMNDINLIINIMINSVIQEFNVIFKEAPPIVKNEGINLEKYPEIIPLYIYEKDKNDKYSFRQIKNNNDITEDPKKNIFATPFEIQNMCPIDEQKEKDNIIIKFNIKSKDKINTFYILDDTGKFYPKDKNKSKIQISEIPKVQAGYLILEKLYKYAIHSLPLIGVFNGEWYPIINNFELNEEIEFNSYKYDNYFYRNNKTLSQKFLDFFSSSEEKLKNDFRSIGNLIIQDSVFDQIDEIINKFPDAIKSQLISDIRVKPINLEIKKIYKDSWFLFKDSDLIKGTIYEYLYNDETKVI